MAEWAVQSAVQLIGNLLVQEATFLLTVSEKIEKLEEELEWMQLFLRDADEKQHHDAMIRKWISKIKDFAYEAEDITENYLLKVSTKSIGGFWNGIKRFPCVLRNARALHEIGSDLDILTQKITDLTTRMTTYGVTMRHRENDYFYSYARQRELRRTVSHISEDVVGIESDIHKVVHWLRTKECKMIVVHGMGGSGKTTLARKIYQHSTVKRLFVATSWVHISQKFQTQNVFREILLDLTPESDTKERERIGGLIESELPSEVFNTLKKKTCLVVLDDIWTPEDWKLLEPALPTDDSNSKLLLTTRDKNILPDVHDLCVYLHESQKLDKEQSWELLEKKAFDKNSRLTDIDKHVSLGKRMLKHCGGLPLAIIVLGGVLATKKTLKEWKAVDRSMSLSVERHKYRSQMYDQVYDVLGQSYYSLPYHLKPCFLYFGKFPEDYEIPTKKLYQMWIAEGVVAPRVNGVLTEDLLEDDAESYLNCLIQRSLVQTGQRGSKGKIRTCHIHDLTRDMCLKMMEEENFLQAIDDKDFSEKPTGDEASSLVSKSSRRLVIFLEKYEKKDVENFLLTCIYQANPHLRTLSIVPVGDCPKQSSWEWLKATLDELQLLRVLDLEGLNISGHFPRELRNLIHLRYLNLRETSVTQLPSSIGNLKCLQTLDLRVQGLLAIPDVLWKLRRLRHLYLPREYTIRKNEKMRIHLLHQLLTLENINLAKLYLQDLLELENLRKLTVWNGLDKKESLDIILRSKSMTSGWLQHIRIRFEGDILNVDATLPYKCSYFRKIEFIKHPPVTLSPQMLPQSLTSLVFWYGTLLNDPMPVLETLPNLRKLSLDVCYNGTRMECSAQGFPQLVHLKLDGLWSLKQWVVEKGAFPKLVKVEVWNCPLESFPDVLPLTLEIATNVKIKGIMRYKLEPGLIDDDRLDDEVYVSRLDDEVYGYHDETNIQQLLQ